MKKLITLLSLQTNKIPEVAAAEQRLRLNLRLLRMLLINLSLETHSIDEVEAEESKAEVNSPLVEDAYYSTLP